MPPWPISPSTRYRPASACIRRANSSAIVSDVPLRHYVLDGGPFKEEFERPRPDRITAGTCARLLIDLGGPPDSVRCPEKNAGGAAVTPCRRVPTACDKWSSRLPSRKTWTCAHIGESRSLSRAGLPVCSPQSLTSHLVTACGPTRPRSHASKVVRGSAGSICRTIAFFAASMATASGEGAGGWGKDARDNYQRVRGHGLSRMAQRAQLVTALRAAEGPASRYDAGRAGRARHLTVSRAIQWRASCSRPDAGHSTAWDRFASARE